jgi:hypothetical protein
MLAGPSKAESTADILREIARARSEARIIARSRGTRFHEHLARTPADAPVSFDTFLREQNKELRAAAKRQDLAGATGRVIDIYG